MAAAATASMLLAIGAPVATANPGTGGSAGPNHHTHTGGAVTPTGKLTSAVKPPRGAIASSGSPTPSVHLNSTPKAAAPATPTPADPGINIGNPPPGTDGVNGNHNYGGQSNFLGLQLYNLGNNNNLVANNFGLGSNVAFLGSGNLAAGENIIDGMGMFGSNFAVLGNNNDNSGANRVSAGFGSNFAIVGSNTIGSGNNFVTGGLFGVNFAIVGDGSMFEGNNEGGLINIAILPGVTGTAGNCTKSVCVDLFGFGFSI